MTSVERTAYRVFPRLMMTRELYLFSSRSQEEMAWAREETDTDEHLLALTLALKCFQRLGRFTTRPVRWCPRWWSTYGDAWSWART